jgi:LmbE family N-acetylglucosaminyl deacetylase
LSEDYRMLAIVAHPDDEALGMGGTLAKYASEGVATHVLTATRGERGRFGDALVRPPAEVVGQTREQELRAAARCLGVADVQLLDYMDGDLDRADPHEAEAAIAAHIRRVRPQVVLTFGPEGAYGHPDHIAISQFTTAACVLAADSDFRVAQGDGLAPWRVAKLYFLEWSAAKWAAYQLALKDLKTTVDGVERRVTAWPDWAITTRIDTSAHWPTVWEAVQCHKTQMSIYEKLAHLPEDHHRALWGTQEFYRVFSTASGGRRPETDLFEGLR